MPPLTEEQRHGNQGQSSSLQQYLGEFVYGGINGSVTTFAVVAGASGAELSPSVIIILGFANLFADGLSMSIGSYLSHQSEKDNYEKHRKIEYWGVKHLPEESAPRSGTSTREWDLRELCSSRDLPIRLPRTATAGST